MYTVHYTAVDCTLHICTLYNAYLYILICISLHCIVVHCTLQMYQFKHIFNDNMIKKQIQKKIASGQIVKHLHLMLCNTVSVCEWLRALPLCERPCLSVKGHAFLLEALHGLSASGPTSL